MHFCYVDESGCPGALPSVNSAIQPVFLIGGLIIEHASLSDLTHDFIEFKQKFFPSLTQGCTSYLDCMLPEVKGSELRKMARQNRNKQRYAFGVIDNVLKILETYNARIIGRIWIKKVGDPFDGRAVYTTSIQAIAKGFQSFLEEAGAEGMIIADARTKPLNSMVAHSVFTQKFKRGGDSYKRIYEMPVFGHSDNHAGIQLADIVCSTILYSIACAVYCDGHMINKTHVHRKHLEIKDKFGERIKKLQYRYQNSGRWHGGLTVSDPQGCKSSSCLF